MNDRELVSEWLYTNSNLELSSKIMRINKDNHHYQFNTTQ